MSKQFAEQALRFEFDDDWLICRPEECAFYKRHFQSFAGGCKEVDFLAYHPDSKTLWLIEVKDYSWFSRTKSLAVDEELVLKVRDTLAMLPLGFRDSSPGSGSSVTLRELWTGAKQLELIRVVLHCEIPRSPSKLFPGVKDYANLQTRLRRVVRAVDPHALVRSRSDMQGIPWQVT